MSLEVQENISCFVDGELDANLSDDLLNHLNDNEEQKKVLGRYCVMSDAIKRNLPETMNHNLLERVQIALESEPALLAPAPNNTENELPEAEIVELPKKVSKESSFSPAFGFGIAATVTLAAVLGFQMFTGTEDLPTQAPIASVTTIEPATQEITIAVTPKTTSPAIAVTTVVDQLPADSGNATYAEQSLIDDGQWTRITQVGDIPLENNFLSNGAEAHVQFKLQGQDFPFAQSVNLGKSSAE